MLPECEFRPMGAPALLLLPSLRRLHGPIRAPVTRRLCTKYSSS